jgi:hypothetical protein
LRNYNQKKSNYDVVGVTFGTVEEKILMMNSLWINKQTHKIDYLAYNYQTNDGFALELPLTQG